MRSLMKHVLLLGNQGVGAWTPTSITGLQLWLDASDAATLFQDSAGTTLAVADGDPIGRWADKSGNARHVTQTSAANRPSLKVVSGRQVVRFAGAHNLYSTNTQVIGSDGTWTALGVANRSSGTGVATIIVQDNALSGRVAQFLRCNLGNLESIAFNAAKNSFTDNGGAHGTTYNVLSAVRGAATIEAWLNGTSNGSTPTTGTTAITETAPIYVGKHQTSEGGAYLNGDIVELMIYNRALSIDERIQAEAYLTAKWLP